MNQIPEDEKITREEMVQLFGEEMPIEAMEILWNSPPDWTIGKIRKEVRRIAKERNDKISGKEKNNEAKR